MADYWEAAYRSGHRQDYPWDCVVSFVFRAAPEGIERRDVHILEVGFGSGSNLRFAAGEGFSVAGIEASATAVDTAKARFAADGLDGDLRRGSFTDLPFPDASFDLIIDRAALSCAPRADIALAVGEIGRVARPGARFFFNPYADDHASAAAGRADGPGTRIAIDAGSLAGLDRITFVTSGDIDELFRDGWELEAKTKLEMRETLPGSGDMHSEWRVVARRL